MGYEFLRVKIEIEKGLFSLAVRTVLNTLFNVNFRSLQFHTMLCHDLEVLAFCSGRRKILPNQAS